jgi:hypothetical protein
MFQRSHAALHVDRTEYAGVVQIDRVLSVCCGTRPQRAEEITFDDFDDFDGPGDFDEPVDPQDSDRPADPPSSMHTLTEANDTDHHSLNLTRRHSTPNAPRAIIYVHLAAEALTAGTGIGLRPDNLARRQAITPRVN